MHIKGAHRICSSSTVKMLLTVPRTKNKINVIFGQSAIEYINKEDFKARLKAFYRRTFTILLYTTSCNERVFPNIKKIQDSSC